ncbi:HipA domain-containing protein [Paracoccus seriniphilus]|uniref:HipA domain-containing protein n=1 Tax=Paracoccus seriniphilus TaxID=184748 RepID=UPI001C5294E5|nr:HipA domain-containing protein [Paracoccus seriniphilus]
MNEKGEVFHPDQSPVPRLANIEELRAIAARYERDPDGAEAEARDLVGAAGSLGGARPKANVMDGQELWIAKFTSIDDTWPVERLEIATLKMARAVGIRTPEVRLELAASRHPVGLIRRFDRRKGGRLPYVSARTALGKKELLTVITPTLQMLFVKCLFFLTWTFRSFGGVCCSPC